MAARYSFEVQVLYDKSWITEVIVSTETEAQTLCKELLGKGREGVRILKEADLNGKVSETVIFTKLGEPKKEKIGITEISEAPYCNSETEFFSPDARQTIYRIMRQYIDKMAVTPTELLHNDKELRRLVDYDSLVPSAITRVAQLQARAGGIEVKDRRDQLYKVIDSIQGKARETGGRRNLPEIKDKNFDAVIAELERTTRPDDIAYVALVVLCKDLVGCRSFIAKLEFLLDLFESAAQPRCIDLLDGVLGDILRSPEVITDLLGRLPRLELAIARLTDVVQGSLAEDERGLPPPTRTLSRHLQAKSLPQTRDVLVECIVRQILGKGRLTHDEDDLEKEALKRVSLKLMQNGDLLGGGAVADALTLRYQRFLKESEAASARNAVIGMLSLLDVNGDKLRFLVALSDGEIGRREPDAVTSQISYVLRFCRGMNDLVDRTLQLKIKLQAVTRLHRQLMRSKLADPLRKDAADRLDEMMAQYITDMKIIEKLDEPSASLRIRALRLIQFCDEDTVIRGKSHALARDRVIAQLRQPNFDARFVEDIPDPAQHARALRNFHQMLTKAGFA